MVLTILAADCETNCWGAIEDQFGRDALFGAVAELFGDPFVGLEIASLDLDLIVAKFDDLNESVIEIMRHTLGTDVVALLDASVAIFRLWKQIWATNSGRAAGGIFERVFAAEQRHVEARENRDDRHHSKPQNHDRGGNMVPTQARTVLGRDLCFSLFYTFRGGICCFGFAFLGHIFPYKFFY